jgi:serine/threonine-protein kinase
MSLSELSTIDRDDYPSQNYESELFAQLKLIRFEEHFQLIQELGTGGGGVVWKARDRNLPIGFVAIKRMLPSRPGNSHEIERFLDEARAAGKLNTHQNVVAIKQLLRDEQGPLLVLEYVNGGNLVDWVEKQPEKRAAEKDAVKFICEAGAGLAFLHQSQLIHRDVKPQNILLHHEFDANNILRHSYARITDFGIARNLDELRQFPSSTPSSLTGTRAYMAPELLAGRSLSNEGTDQYALAATLWFLLTGRHPEASQKSLVELIPGDTSQQTRAALQKALAPNPLDRFRSIDDFVRELKTRFSQPPTVGPTPITAATPPHGTNDQPNHSRGLCRSCGVVHDALVDQPIPTDVRYCLSPNCRASLVDCCLNCSREIWIWDQHCCRCNQCTTKAAALEQHLLDRRHALKNAFDERQLTAVLDGLSQIKKSPDLQHRRLAHARSWCTELETELENQIERLAHEGKQFLNDRRFEEAANILRQIPVARRINSQYRDACEKRDLVKNLETRFLNALQTTSLSESLEPLQQILVLQPFRTELTAQLHSRVADIDAQARREIQNCNYAAATELLTSIPEALRDQPLLLLASQRRNEILALEKRLQSALAECCLADLHNLLSQLKKLAPAHPGVSKAEMELNRLVEMRHLQAEGLAELNRDYKAALACLNDVPEDLIRTNVRSSLIERLDRIEQLENQLRQALDRGDLLNAWEHSEQLNQLTIRPSTASLAVQTEAQKRNTEAETIAHRQKNWMLAIRFLENIPEPLRNQALYCEVATAVRRIEELQNSLRRALEKEKLKRADTLATELAALQPELPIPNDQIRRLAEKFLKYAAKLVIKRQDYDRAQIILDEIPLRFREQHWKTLANRRSEIQSLSALLHQHAAENNLDKLHEGLVKLQKLQPQHPELPLLTATLKAAVLKIETTCAERADRFLEFENAAAELVKVPAPLRNLPLHTRIISAAHEIRVARERIHHANNNRDWNALEAASEDLLRILPNDYRALLHLKLAREELKIRRKS